MIPEPRDRVLIPAARSSSPNTQQQTDTRPESKDYGLISDSDSNGNSSEGEGDGAGVGSRSRASTMTGTESTYTEPMKSNKKVRYHVLL